MDNMADSNNRRFPKFGQGDYRPRYNRPKKFQRNDRGWRNDNFSEENRGQMRQGNQLQEPIMFNLKIQVNLIGKKVKDPMIHVCETCSLPIRCYGRMIPCKHVFCFSCAKKTGTNCPRCKDSVQRIEQCPLGSVWLCGVTNDCRRTYLSQRDLQAHINHRHSKPPAMPPPPMPPASLVGPPPPINVPPINVPPPGFLPAGAPPSNIQIPPASMEPMQSSGGDVVTAPRRSSNLITVQIQDDQAPAISPRENNNSLPPPPPPPGRPPNQPQHFSAQPQQGQGCAPNMHY